MLQSDERPRRRRIAQALRSAKIGEAQVLQRDNIVESLIAIVMIAVAIGFLLFASVVTGSGGFATYEITARMAHVDGIDVGSDVRIAGVKIGTVRAMTLDMAHYYVTLVLDIREDIPVPRDSHLIVSGGMQGGAALTIKPGHSRVMIPPGGALS